MKESHKRAMEVLKDSTIQLDEFSELYGADVIQRDKAEVERIKKTFEPHDRNKFAADILEGILCKEAELSDWLGPYAQTLKTSEYDDIKNGVDMVVEFNLPQQARSHLALGVDATFGTRTIQKKFERIKREIEEGELARIKYFRSQNGGFMGQLSNIPRVVTGIDREHLLELAGTWNQNRKKELAVHPAQRLVLTQMNEQLRTFRDYAERIGRKDTAQAFAQSRGIILPILREKQSIPLAELENDKVHREILTGLEMFK